MIGVFLDHKTVDRGDVTSAVISQTLPQWRFVAFTQQNELCDRIAEASIVVTNKVCLGEQAFRAAPNLKLVCVAATGTNNIDLQAAKQAGVTVCNVPSYSTPAVVQQTFAMMLSLMMRLNSYQQAVAGGAWQASPFFSFLDYPIHEVSGKTLGIVGYGGIGKAVAGVAEAFGMNVLVAERRGVVGQRGRVPLHELLPQVDVLSLHCPLTPETRNLIDKAELALMKPSAILLNLARGGVVHEQALLDALLANKLAGAGVDVLTTEPPSTGNPLLSVQIPQLIVTPHIAWASVEARQRLINEIALNIEAFLRGVPRNVVV